MSIQGFPSRVYTSPIMTRIVSLYFGKQGVTWFSFVSEPGFDIENLVGSQPATPAFRTDLAHTCRLGRVATLLIRNKTCDKNT